MCLVGLALNYIVLYAKLHIRMNGMMEKICSFEGKSLETHSGPWVVRGRNSNNALILEKPGWKPSIKLADGLKITYDWMQSQLAEVRRQATCTFPVLS